MGSQTIKKTLDTVSGIVDRIVEPDIRAAFGILFNLVETLSAENEELRKTNQTLKDEINRLNGEQGKPGIRPQKKDKDNHSSEDDRKKRKKKKTKKKRAKKKDVIKVDRSVVCKIDSSELPEDAVRKGYKPVVIQDIIIKTDNIEFQREVYYSPSLNKTFIAELPKGYSGEFGPELRSLVVSLYHDSNMTEPAIIRFLNTCGIVIAPATISRMLTDKHEVFHQEKEDIVDAGLKAQYQHTDDTSARVNGKNHYVHIFSSPFHTAYFTCPKKDRLTIVEILCRGELKFSFNTESFQLMETMGLPEKRLKQLIDMKIEGEMTRVEIDALLLEMFPNPKKHSSNRRHILEATALTYYHSLPHALKHLICDDAPQFNFIATHKSLCWIHEGRHYKKLHPVVPFHQQQLDNFREKFWDFYQALLNYTQQPTTTVTTQLEKEFDELFTTETGYPQLDDRIALTLAKKEALLLPLTFPFLPLHNNDAEGGAQHQARLRDIHLQTKNEKGTKAKDTFATIVKTARKLKINIIDYIHDRISETFEMPSLADLILEKCRLQPNTS